MQSKGRAHTGEGVNGASRKQRDRRNFVCVMGRDPERNKILEDQPIDERAGCAKLCVGNSRDSAPRKTRRQECPGVHKNRAIQNDLTTRCWDAPRLRLQDSQRPRLCIRNGCDYAALKTGRQEWPGTEAQPVMRMNGRNRISVPRRHNHIIACTVRSTICDNK